MKTAKQLFDEGKLPAAIEAATAEVKAHPGDGGARTLLFELLCFAGDLERAEKHLDVIGQQSTESEWAAQVYRNILAAERKRRKLYSDSLRPSFFTPPSAFVERHLEAVAALRGGQPQRAAALLEESGEGHPALRGDCGGRRFESIRDWDDVLAPVLELIFIQDYVWLPLAQIQSLETNPPERLRDLLWLPARIVMTDETKRSGYLPVLYAGSHEHPDDRIKLGRVTESKVEEGGPVLGLGAHAWIVDDGDVGLLDCRRLVFEPAAAM